IVGLTFSGTAPANLLVRENQISGASGITIAVSFGGSIEKNDIVATGTGIDLRTDYAGVIRDNEIHGASVGVAYNASGVLSRNRIHDNTAGVVSRLAEKLKALGFVGMADPNEIFANATGVN